MASDAWWFAYLIVTIPVTAPAVAAIAIGVWANRDADDKRDRHPHLPAE